MHDARPLLFFDSGVGGLSVLGPTRALLPHAPIVYAADSAGFPYGTRSDAEIAARVPALLGRLTERFHPRLIVIACNTASTIALAAVRSALDLPIVGTVPAIKPAAEESVTRTIGVLGTLATVRQGYVEDLTARFASDCTVLRHGSAALVRLAEAKLRGETTDIAAYRAAIAGLFDQPGGERIDIVVGGLRAELALPAGGGRSQITFDHSSLLSRGTTRFSFMGVEQEEDGKNRGVLISGLEIAVVPVPAAILSLGAGLVLLVGLGRLRRGSTRKPVLGKAAA